MADNRRSSTRHDVDLPARIQVGDVTEDSRVTNLSMGGAGVQLRRLPMGQRVTVWFRVPTLEAEIHATGIVRWTTDDGAVGVQFDGLRAKETWALGEYFEVAAAAVAAAFAAVAAPAGRAPTTAASR